MSFTLKHFPQLVQSILEKKPGGDIISKEYRKTKYLTDSTRRKMITILVADMTERHGTSPPRHIRERYAEGIIALFPCLRDPFSKKGYEHYFDPQSGEGYLSWKIKNIQRNCSQKRGQSSQSFCGGPTAERRASNISDDLSEEECKDAISFMKHCSDETTIKQKMQATFQYRRRLIEDPNKYGDVLLEFPRFKDMKGLIEQDFTRLFGGVVSAKFLEKWPTAFKHKIIAQSKGLHPSRDLQELIAAAESVGNDDEENDAAWDHELAGILLLLHLIPPVAQGRKRPGKMSASMAENHVVMFLKTGNSVQEHLDAIQESKQPYLLAAGPKKNTIHAYYIVLDKYAIPCMSASAVGAFDELFKIHFVFGTSYNKVLHNMYTFIQTTIYEIDVGQVKETPRVAELRARLLN
ncbi:hypothetical protein PO909_006466 [Leuciscus waleckii]